MGGRSLKRRWALNVSHSSGCTPALVQERVRADRIGTSSTGAPYIPALRFISTYDLGMYPGCPLTTTPRLSGGFPSQVVAASSVYDLAQLRKAG